MNLRPRLLLPLLCMPAVALADPPDFDRPGAGFATTVVPAWTLAWEQGLPTYQRERPGGVLQGTYTADSLFRIGLGGPLELQAGGSAFNRFEQEDRGRRQHHLGHGDSSVGLKFAPGGSAPAGDFSWAALAKITYANGDRDLSNDARQYSLGTTMQWKPDDIHQNTLYVNLDRLGRQNTWTIAPTFGRQFGDHLSAYLEADLIHDGSAGNEVQAGGGIAYDIGDHVQLDAYALHRIGSHGPSLVAGLGVSVFFGRAN